MKPLTPPQSVVRRLSRTLLIGIALFAVVSGARAAPANVAVEYRVKAAYLYNFTKFVEWPPRTFDGSERLVLGVLDLEGSAVGAITDALHGKLAPGGRPIEVRRLEDLGPEAEGCHQIFVTKNAGVSPEQVRRALNGAPILVVGETDDFALHGGTIGLVVSGDAVRCEVNLAGAERAGLKMSGRLASIARLVREAPRK